jgi:hypothetical protein
VEISSVYLGNTVRSLYMRDGYGPYGDIKTFGGVYGCMLSAGEWTFGPKIGDPDGKWYMTAVVGSSSTQKDAFVTVNGQKLYSRDREDNDYTAFVYYDYLNWKQYEVPFRDELDVNLDGPTDDYDESEFAFFYFGDHDYGPAQTLAYDPYARAYFLSPYSIADRKFPDYYFYVVDAAAKPVWQEQLYGQAPGVGGWTVKELCGLPGIVRDADGADTGIRVAGYNKIQGSVGLHAFGDGRYYIAESYRAASGVYGAYNRLYTWNIDDDNRWTMSTPFLAAGT